MNTKERISLGLVIRFENKTTQWGTTLKYLDIAIPKYLYPDMRTIYLTLPYAEYDNYRRYCRQHEYFFFKLDSQKKMKSLLTKLKNKEKKQNADRTED